MGNQEYVDIVIHDIKQEIQEKSMKYEEKVSFEPPHAESGYDAKCQYDPQLHYDFPIHSQLKVVGKFVVLVRRIIRKILQFLLVPIIEEQTTINKKAIAEMNRMKRQIEMQESVIEELKSRMPD